jgi:type VI secretion system secreted protein Hcp
MAVDYFLEIEGIRGESSDEKHKEEIELLSFSWGQTNPAGAGGGGGGGGKVQVQDILFTMRVSKASPQLLLSCASGQQHKSAILTVRKAGKSQQEFLTIKLTDVLVSSYQTSGSVPSDDIFDQASLAFSTIQVDFRPQKEDGALDVPVTAGWDVKNNKPL